MPVNSFENYPLSWRPNRELLKRPIYQSLSKMLEDDICSGKLVAGTKLPPQRELADFLDINFTTITRVYKQCELKGLIYAVKGSGTFVASYASQSATISTNGAGQHSVIDLGFVASFEECNSMVKSGVKKVAEKNYLDKLLNYDNPTGLPHQKIAAISWMNRFGVELDEEHIAIVSGTQNGLAIALMACFSAGNKIAVDVFTYANFIELAKINHLQLIPVQGDSEGMIASNLREQCEANLIKGIFLMPSCSNPTTISMSEQRKIEIAQIIEEYSLISIEDDINGFLTINDEGLQKAPLTKHLSKKYVYLSGTSKPICSGLRVAYMVFSEDLKERLQEVIFNVNVKTSSLDSEIITELILDGTAHKIENKKRELASEANEIFYSYFPNIKGIGEEHSFFRWLPIKSELSGALVEEYFLKYGIRVYHSDRFLCGNKRDKNYLRIALSTVNFDTLDKGLSLLRKIVEET